MKDSTIRFRENNEIKEKASDIFASMGLDLSAACRMFLRKVVQTNSIPFTMESGYTLKGEQSILKALNEHETEKTYSSTEEMFKDLEDDKS